MSFNTLVLLTVLLAVLKYCAGFSIHGAWLFLPLGCGVAVFVVMLIGLYLYEKGYMD